MSQEETITRYVQVDCTIGSFVLELYTNHAPKSCYNLATLASIGYYEDTIIHRVIKDFMIQMGDPTGTGRGGESVFGGHFEDEITPELKFTGAGILAMANSGTSSSNGSQFFITLAPSPWLDGKHTIFGRVCSGMKIIQRLGSIATDSNDKPLNDMKILRAFPSDSSEVKVTTKELVAMQ